VIAPVTCPRLWPIENASRSTWMCYMFAISIDDIGEVVDAVLSDRVL